jgi:hypothetical protein
MAQTPYNSIVALSYAHIASATTTTVKAAPGALMKLIINSGAVGTITVYDSLTATGNVIGVITLSAAVTVPTAWFSGSDAAITCRTGLTIVTSAACDLTVLYR